MPPTYQAYTTYQWSALLKILRQMQITGSPCEEVSEEVMV